MITTNKNTEQKRKSVRLSKEEIKALGKYVKTTPSLIEAAIEIGIDRNVLGRVLIVGSGSPATIDKIRQKLAA